MSGHIAVRQIDGRVCVCVAVTDQSRELADALRGLNDLRIRNGRLPLPLASDLAAALRYAAQVADITGSVASTQQPVEAATLQAAGLVTPAQAASILGIDAPAVTARIRRGRLNAQRVGRSYLIRIDDLAKEAS